MVCVFSVEETQGIQELSQCELPLNPAFLSSKAPQFGMLSTGRLFLPVGVVEPRVSLRRQSADLLPVCDQLFPLHLNLSGAQRVRLLQAVCLGTQGFDLETHSVRTALPTLDDLEHRLLLKPTLSSNAARSLSKPSCFRSRA